MLVLLTACTGGSGSPDDGGPGGVDPSSPTDPTTHQTGTVPPGSAPTWWRDVRPVVLENCATCHAPGDIGPFPLTSFAEAKPWAAAMAEVTAAGTMPPWPPSADCAPLQGDRRLTQDKIDLLAAWADADAPEGDPDDATEVVAPVPFTGDLHLEMTEGYTPPATADDYRCFVVDWPEAARTYVTAYQVFPEARELVHHVILFVADAGVAHDADANDPGPGYECWGTAGIPATTLGSWVPGVSGVELPAGTGVPMDPGQAVIVQVHYNTLVSQPREDLTSIELDIADQVDQPAAPILYTDPAWLLGAMDIPAGDPDVELTTTLSTGIMGLLANSLAGGSGYTLHRVSLHMHTLGTSTSLRLRHGDGSTECLLDIPSWDFHWQGGYNLVDSVRIESGDQIEMACTWDNSAPGAVDVNWGESTADEMCLMGLYLTR